MREDYFYENSYIKERVTSDILLIIIYNSH
jgi:hypothetical protein